MAGLYRRLITEGKKAVPEAGGAHFQASVWQEQRAGRMTGVRKVLFTLAACKTCRAKPSGIIRIFFF